MSVISSSWTAGVQRKALKSVLEMWVKLLDLGTFPIDRVDCDSHTHVQRTHESLMKKQTKSYHPKAGMQMLATLINSNVELVFF